MRVAPRSTALPAAPLTRTHTPTSHRYTDYRDCARWDFGFTCAICLLHEGDLIDCGAKGTGLLSIEHAEPQSVNPGRAADYGNCLYACRFCNGSRSNKPTVDLATGTSLLDPTVDAWANHFVFDGSNLMPIALVDARAVRTHIAYDLGDARKAKCRANRLRRMEHLEKAKREAAELVPALTTQALKTTDTQEKTSLLNAAAALRVAYDQAKAEVERYEMPPKDRPTSCRCGGKRDLPLWLQQQLVSA